MNSLQQSIERRRAAEPESFSCVDVGSRPGLVLSVWQSGVWFLPWSHLQGALLEGEPASESLRFWFTHHEVTINGANLRGLLADVAGQRLAEVRNAPAQYRSRVAPDAPFVVGIDVREIGAAGGGTG